MDGKTASFNQHFDLKRQFALLSLVLIVLIGTLSAFLLSDLFTRRILDREAKVSQEFITSIVETDGTWRFFSNRSGEPGRAVLDAFFTHIAFMPDVVRANVYSNQGEVLWSSEKALIGERFNDNPELENALSGALEYESGLTGSSDKDEHEGLSDDQRGLRFIELYIPIWNGTQDQVVGAVELYKVPRALHQSINEGQRLIWISALLAGTVLFSGLFWIVSRASRIMAEQQRNLVESRSLAMIGETASAVAHSMRNPLASIRASAELTLSDDLEGARESAEDIIQEADRLDRWARDLLQFSSLRKNPTEPIDLRQLVIDLLAEHRPLIERQQVNLQLDLSDAPSLITADAAPLSQALGNLLMNSLEALEGPGTISLSLTRQPANRVTLRISDNGPGLPAAVKARLFRPFTTTKPSGTGLGLALTKRLVELYDGELSISSPPGGGVSATIRFPCSE